MVVVGSAVSAPAGGDVLVQTAAFTAARPVSVLVVVSSKVAIGFDAILRVRQSTGAARWSKIVPVGGSLVAVGPLGPIYAGIDDRIQLVSRNTVSDTGEIEAALFVKDGAP